ncbi:MAG: hypothetical protein VKJ27_00710 [Synechocystis sp.]|nr:hypothetical protein [Synechocystis sp.]
MAKDLFRWPCFFHNASIEIYIAVALVYLVLTTLSSFLFKTLESRMDPVGRAKKLAAKLSPT